ncbi:imelysin family protein [Vibrio ziniensis]|uniref:Iron-regulated protein A n=1 Tax=Vibrio ziniensis TaxID=2711221 RepID=A0A6G7CIS3_9VIBR|nr:imelysin family protein [Vibrio ziniensis]QIH41970.1 iron-regulated protein A [Vibrio ziniensis]
MTFKYFLPSILVLSLTACQSNQTASYADQTRHVSQSTYLVEYQAANHFSVQAHSLAQAFANYCETDVADNSELKQQWHTTMLAWMALQGQERGPADALAQSWNVQFWPDKKNTTGLKMTALTKQDKFWTAAEISENSVTVQGLGALEWLIYDSKSPLTSSKAQACMSATAISKNLANRADTIEKAWRTNPWTKLDEQSWKSEYIALLSNQLEFSMSKLSRPLANIGKPRPYFSESWRSKTSMFNLKANVEAMQALYLSNGSGLDQMLRDRGLVDLADRVKTQYANLVEAWPEEGSLFDLLQTKDGYRMVLSQYNKMDQLKYLLHDEVSVALDVVIGFNATDGD